jgi:hypothetical protein
VRGGSLREAGRGAKRNLERQAEDAFLHLSLFSLRNEGMYAGRARGGWRGVLQDVL